MLHSKNITPQNIRTMFAVYGRVVDLLLTEADRVQELSTELAAVKKAFEVNDKELAARLTPWVTCFVAMPFGDKGCEQCYLALERILEDEPYFWNVIRAKRSDARCTPLEKCR